MFCVSDDIGALLLALHRQSVPGSKRVCKTQSQVHHEKRGAANAASFFADGLSATIHTVQQVLLCAVLLNVHRRACLVRRLLGC